MLCILSFFYFYKKDMNTSTQITKQKEINKQNVIVKWIKDVNGHNPVEAKEFIKERGGKN